uniref:Uncharacterized protein n=1 Tax=Anguilla anguilla TaxID=7936 RepID=A0A0E9VIS8_ANGAN
MLGWQRFANPRYHRLLVEARGSRDEDQAVRECQIVR